MFESLDDFFADVCKCIFQDVVIGDIKNAIDGNGIACDAIKFIFGEMKCDRFDVIVVTHGRKKEVVICS